MSIEKLGMPKWGLSMTEGRLVECWGVADRFALLQQLGIIPSDDELAAKMPELEGAD